MSTHYLWKFFFSLLIGSASVLAADQYVFKVENQSGKNVDIAVLAWQVTNNGDFNLRMINKGYLTQGWYTVAPGKIIELKYWVEQIDVHLNYNGDVAHAIELSGNRGKSTIPVIRGQGFEILDWKTKNNVDLKAPLFRIDRPGLGTLAPEQLRDNGVTFVDAFKMPASCNVLIR